MTATLHVPAQVSGTEKPTPLILRRGDLDLKDALICGVVWALWSIGYCPTYREIDDNTGIPYKTVFRRIGGRDTYTRRDSLTKRGWLRMEAGLARTIRPGPRFVGLDSDGWPLEVVE